MRTTACLILGTYLAIQAVPMNASQTAHAMSIGLDPLTVPIHHLKHARELLDRASYNRLADGTGSAAEYSKFILDRTRDMLPAAWKPQAERIARTLVVESNRHQMDPLFLVAVIQQESRFRPGAIGGQGEIGLMQMKPSTARWILKRNGVVPPSDKRLRKILKDPATNIRYGAAYLAHLRESFDGRRHQYIAAYNMGPSNVRELLRDKSQPRIYSNKVLAHYRGFATDFMIALAETSGKVASAN